MKNGNSLITLGESFTSGLKMLEEAMTTEWESAEERDAFMRELIVHIAGDETSLAQKVVGIKNFLDFLDTREEQYKDFKSRVNAAETTIKTTRERIKGYVLMVLHNIEKTTGKRPSLDLDGVKLSYQNCGDKEPVVITDESCIPHTLKRYEITINNLSYDEAKSLREYMREKKLAAKSDKGTPDRNAIKAALKGGESIDGAHISPQAERISIVAFSTRKRSIEDLMYNVEGIR
jgi:hypothetical protein